jgi:hypothetical protein
LRLALSKVGDTYCVKTTSQVIEVSSKGRDTSSVGITGPVIKVSSF